MARRPALRLILDVAVLAAVIAGAAVAVAWSAPAPAPPMPAGVCAGDGAPRYELLHADGRLTIAALFGQIGDRPIERDFGAVSRRRLERELAARGFVREADDHWTRVDRGLTIDVAITGPAALPRALPAITAVALDRALAEHDLVYYDGHAFDGTLPLATPAGHHAIAVLDSCWSTQHYSAGLVGGSVDVIGNRERSITGSVESFVALLDGLDARAPRWSAILAAMNERARARAAARAGRTSWDRAEDYRLDVACAP